MVEESILPGINIVYGNPAECNEYYDGEYRGDCFLTNEVIETLLGEEKEVFKDDLKSSIIQKSWSKRNEFSESEKRISESLWQEFCNIVKTKTRYLFYNDQTASILLTIKQYLEHVGKESKTGVFKILRAGQRRFFRARLHCKKDLDKYESLKEFGPPPNKNTKSYRMSAEGICLFYCSYEEETALCETRDEESECISIGSFSLCKDICVLDLNRVSALPVPGIFNTEKRNDIDQIGFLRKFVKDISKPIIDNPGIEYVPTQIITEYLRCKLLPPEAFTGFKRIDGIIYPSSKQPGGKCLVLFMDYKDFCSSGDKCYLDKNSFQCVHYHRNVEYKNDIEE